MRLALPPLPLVAVAALGGALVSACGTSNDTSPGGQPTSQSQLDAGPEADAPSEAESDTALPDRAGPDSDVADAADDDSSPTDAQPDTAPGTWAPYAIVSLNLHCLKLTQTSFPTNADRFHAIAQAVAAQGVAAMTVQEACETTSESAMHMLHTALEAATGKTWSAEWVETHVAWQGTPDQADEGVGILAQGHLANAIQIAYRTQGSLRRLALMATLPPELGGLRLTTVHLDLDDEAVRAAQARETAVATLLLADPSLDVLVGGDFNAQQGQPPYAALTAFGFDDLTSSLDPTDIDHVMAHRGAAVSLVAAAPIFDGTTTPIVSDHHGVLVRIAPGIAPNVPRTRIRAAASLGATDWLALRGNVAPLTWAAGCAAWESSGGPWEVLLTEIPSGVPFEFKLLRNDLDWEQGSNHAGSGGATIDVTPAF